MQRVRENGANSWSLIYVNQTPSDDHFLKLFDAHAISLAF